MATMTTTTTTTMTMTTMTTTMSRGHGCCFPSCASALASIAETKKNPSLPPRFFLHSSPRCRNRPFSAASRAVQGPFPYAIGLSFPSSASAADSLPETSSQQAVESSGDSVAAASGVADGNLAINILGVAAFVGVVVLTVAVCLHCHVCLLIKVCVFSLENVKEN
jgi:hypothetical protein